MAGSFGYEKNIMRLVCKWERILYFQKISTAATTSIAAAGTSCRAIKF
jgi:hypothetical protein